MCMNLHVNKHDVRNNMIILELLTSSADDFC